MDLPFSDGISGSLEIEVTAQTPLYVRNGGKWPEKTTERNNDPDYLSFFKLPSGDYAIPGTSLKGAIRNVVEIASFGKMRRVADHRYGFRDLYNPDYTNRITERTKSGKRPRVKAGWLKNSGEKWMLTPCEFGRIDHSKLRDLNTSLCSAIEKYKSWSMNGLVADFTIAPEAPHPHSCGPLLYREVTAIGRGPIKGTLVFTGQPTKQKHMEFVFFNEQSNQQIAVDDKVRKEFVFIHSDDRGKPYPEWKYWSEKLKAGGSVPVFYLEAPPGVQKSMGLAMMYRLPYEYGIHDLLQNSSSKHLTSDPDLADLLFGNCHEPENALRGRVQFGLLKAVGAPSPLDTVTTVLGGPKPTFYPSYLRQNLEDPETGKVKKDRFSTYNDKAAKLSGWKRYHVRDSGFKPQPPQPPTADVATRFAPLDAGTVFSGRIHIHNLRPEELGALIWALTWGGDNALCHGLGMAKPLGYGAVKIKINRPSLTNMRGQEVDPIAARTAFSALMANKISGWEKTDEIQSLKEMARPLDARADYADYPILNLDTRQNDFAKFKGAKQGGVASPKVALRSPLALAGLRKPMANEQNPKSVSTQSMTPKPPPDPLTVLLGDLKASPNLNVKTVATRLNSCTRATPEQVDRLQKLLEKRNDYKWPAFGPIRKAFDDLTTRIVRSAERATEDSPPDNSEFKKP
jgi:CRISPR-associated protein (TIGR03986 family)